MPLPTLTSADQRPAPRAPGRNQRPAPRTPECSCAGHEARVNPRPGRGPARPTRFCHHCVAVYAHLSVYASASGNNCYCAHPAAAVRAARPATAASGGRAAFLLCHSWGATVPASPVPQEKTATARTHPPPRAPRHARPFSWERASYVGVESNTRRALVTALAGFLFFFLYMYIYNGEFFTSFAVEVDVDCHVGPS